MEDAALARCVGDIAHFRQEHWGRRPLLRRAAGPFDDLLGIDDVERLLGRLGRRPTFRLVRDGGPVPVTEYTRTVRVGGAGVDGVADIERIIALVAAGATVVLQALQRTWEPLAVFCAELGDATSHPVQANAYLSPGGGVAGLGRHADTHQVLALQVAGSKAWDVEGLGKLVLDAGDVLYLPAGTRHVASTGEAVSLHITIGILAITGRQLLRRVLDGVDSGLDQPLPLGFASEGGAAELTAFVAGSIDALGVALRALRPDDVATHEAQRARRHRAPPVGRLRVAADRSAVHDADRLRRRTPLVVLDTGGDDELVLEFAGRRLRVPPVVRDAAAMIQSRLSFAVADLPGLDEPSRAVLARRLIREGLVEIEALPRTGCDVGPG